MLIREQYCLRDRKNALIRQASCSSLLTAGFSGRMLSVAVLKSGTILYG